MTAATRFLTLSVVLASLILAPAAGAAVDAKPAAGAPAATAGDGPSTAPHPRPTLGSAKSRVVHGFYVVYFREAPLATYAGDVPGLEATSPAARGERKLDARSAASQAYLAFLQERQARHLARIEAALERPVDVVFNYRAAAFGFAARMTAAEAKTLASLPEVRRVVPDRVYPVQTDRGPTWIGAPAIWDGTATGGLPGTKGEGVVVGVIDTGINMDHPSFAEMGGDGFTHTNPLGSGNFLGLCDTQPGQFVCNDKLIGAYDYTDAYCAANPDVCSEANGPEDDDGHGSHTSSTAAGNFLTSPAISGVAPHANLIMYDACYVDPDTGQGLCPFSATSAGADQALLDGVDAINYSIGGGVDPWGGDIDTLFLGLVASGTYVSASAGNDGPAAGTVEHRGPWVSTMGASTHDLVTVENELVNMSGGVSPPADITGASRTTGYGPETIVYAGNFSNGDPDPEQCLNPFPANTWTGGEIVLCDRGTIARVLKCANVAAGGAGGCVLANADATQGAPVPDPHVIPAIHVDFANGNVLRNWLASGSGHTATITNSMAILDPAAGDIMADFSSRGPNLDTDVLKPDLTAPGVNIIAAFATDGVLPPPEFGLLSGTSMSSPHNAGSGALMKALYPGWSPAEIKSAIMLTSDTTVLKEDASTTADPFDRGAGRIDLTKAAETGLVLDETAGNFLAADPDQGGDPASLNLASLQETACVVDCTWTRTFTSVASSTLNWTITTTTPGGVTLDATPNVFSLASGATQAVQFDLDPGSEPFDQFFFAEVQLTEPGGSPALHMPVAVQPALDNFPAVADVETFDLAGMHPLAGLEAALTITNLDVQPVGLVRGTNTDVVISEDPTNGDPFDELGQVFVRLISAPAGARRLIAATSSEEAPDVDLYVGTGTTPSAATQVCSSTTSEATERCEIFDPAPGTYWILVQNWAGSSSQPDLIKLVDGVVPNSDAGNLSASGPSSVTAGDPFQLDVNWNVPSANGGETWFGGLDVGTDPGNPGNIGFIGVDIIFLEADIFTDGFESGDTSAWN